MFIGHVTLLLPSMVQSYRSCHSTTASDGVCLIIGHVALLLPPIVHAYRAWFYLLIFNRAIDLFYLFAKKSSLIKIGRLEYYR